MAATESDIRPVVARGRPSNLGLWVFMAALVIGGLWLFSVMSANRTALTAPRTSAVAPEPGVRIASPPPLALPPGWYGPEPRAWRDRMDQRDTLPPARLGRSDPAPAPAARAATPAYVPPPVAAIPVPGYLPLPQPAVMFERAVQPAPSPATAERADNARILAGRLANPARTVPMGTVIPAVLETALDSTRAGAVRALVQRDVVGFDGSRVLIDRGSRLYGEYEADLAPGQNRALIRWTRLIRPDGVTIALDSPASDPLGRAGVRGKVDSKFLQRFGGAILQSVLDIGVGLATRKATDGVVVALPGSTQNLQVTQSQQVQPTLRVRHGSSVSVFVARDLDFSSVDF